MDKRRHKYTEHFIRHTRDVERVFERLKKKERPGEVEWIFRGHNSSDHDFQTSLERAFLAFSEDRPHGNGKQAREQLRAHLNDILKKGLKDGNGKRLHIQDIEGGLVRRFKRQCYQYEVATPSDENIMEWLALMQHHGAPTRLLDWTYSFFVALYFAVERAEGECVVWALNGRWSDRRFKCEYPHLYDRVDNQGRFSDPNVTTMATFQAVFQAGAKLVCRINPYKLNERLNIQQGIFLCPGDITASFEENLAALAPKVGSKRDFQQQLWKIRIPDKVSLRKEIIRKLHRMNMNRATLFPGLDGFARSLKRTLMAFPETLMTGRDWKAS